MFPGANTKPVKENANLGGVMADIDAGEIDGETMTSVDAERHAMRKLGTNWKKQYPQVENAIKTKFGNKKIKVRAPNGKIGYVNQDKITAAKERGFEVVAE
jgi:creatinine amidohydrolase/Fe(II)-dependent formamide hydrolase-like protein